MIDVARLMNAMTGEQRASLGITDWDEPQAYGRVDWLYNRLCEVLSAGIEGIDAQWFVDRFVKSSIPKRYQMTHSVAVDGTDVESWGAFQGSTTVVLDGEAADTQSSRGTPSSVSTKKKVKVLTVGPDRRNQYTPDPDARAGHRSANSQHPAGPYIGYELHLAVQVRDVRWTNYIDKLSFSDQSASTHQECCSCPCREPPDKDDDARAHRRQGEGRRHKRRHLGPRLLIVPAGDLELSPLASRHQLDVLSDHGPAGDKALFEKRLRARRPALLGSLARAPRPPDAASQLARPCEGGDLRESLQPASPLAPRPPQPP